MFKNKPSDFCLGKQIDSVSDERTYLLNSQMILTINAFELPEQSQQFVLNHFFTYEGMEYTFIFGFESEV